VNVYEAAGLILPLLKLVPSSEVTVWGTASVFVQVTFVPTTTVTVAGENAIEVIDTFWAVGAPEPVSLLLQELLKMAVITIRQIAEKIFIGLIIFN